jgi:hypothetical protein
MRCSEAPSCRIIRWDRATNRRLQILAILSTPITSFKSAARMAAAKASVLAFPEPDASAAESDDLAEAADESCAFLPVDAPAVGAPDARAPRARPPAWPALAPLRAAAAAALFLVLCVPLAQLLSLHRMLAPLEARLAAGGWLASEVDGLAPRAPELRGRADRLAALSEDLKQQILALETGFEAERVYRRAADYLFGLNHADAWAPWVSPAHGLIGLRVAARLGHADALFLYGWYVIDANVAPDEREEAVAMIREAAEHGQVFAIEACKTVLGKAGQ